jgi:hypothetical protein
MVKLKIYLKVPSPQESVLITDAKCKLGNKQMLVSPNHKNKCLIMDEFVVASWVSVRLLAFFFSPS